jgi:hypothetical protein
MPCRYLKGFEVSMVNVSPEKREQLIGDFWEAVRKSLINSYHRKMNEIDLAIGQYRHAVEKKQVGDLLYHQGVDKTSSVINGIIEYGLPDGL